MDAEIGIDAKRAISRQLGEKEDSRTKLEETIQVLNQSSQQGSEKLVREVRQVVENARQNFAQTGDVTTLNRFVEDFIGPIIVYADGRIEQKSAESG